ncbi:MAG: O-antigen ligase family protein [candidate division Zixibacteria bacterium]|nr:O-antigen ligase family protein [candidate division Zixibacteria bacterium]
MIEIKSKNFHTETASAIFIIALVSFFILANFTAGFIFPLFLAVMSAAFLIALFYPRAGLYAVIFLTFIFERFFTLQPIILGRAEYKLYPLDIIFIGVIGGIVIRKIFPLFQKGIRRDFRVKGRRAADCFLMSFIALSAVYFIFSAFVLKNDFALAFSSFKNYAFYSLFYFAVLLLINNKETLARLLKFAAAGAAGIVFFIVYGILSGSGLWSEFTPLSTQGIRILAFPHAFYLSMAVVFSLAYLASDKSARAKKYLYFLVPVWIAGISGSMMRHLWIGLFISIIFLYFIAPRKNKAALRKIAANYFLAVLAIAVFIFYAAALFPHSGLSKSSAAALNAIGNRIASTANIYDESILWRSAAWNSALKEYARNPILGLGFGRKVFIEIGRYKNLVEIRNIHNSFLALLVQTGLLGAGLFIFFIWSTVKNAFKEAREKNDFGAFKMAALSVLMFHLIIFMFQPYLETNLLGIFFWLNLGILRISAKSK